MRTKLKGWYPKSAEEIADIWKTALFVPDANILLHTIRHPKEVREELFRLFAALGDSLWVPYQVALEFHRNRLDVIRSGHDAYEHILKGSGKYVAQMRDQLRQLRAHPTIDIERELAALTMYAGDFNRRIEEARKEHPETALDLAVERLSQLLEDRVGGAWSEEQLVSIKKEGDVRYARKQPPGFEDAKKDGDAYRRYGDLIIWKDMIAKANEAQRPVIFITDDVKQDWWWIHSGRKIGPRPELIEEFEGETNQRFHIYEFKNFVRVAAAHHPEFQQNLATVERSLKQDSEARRNRSQAKREQELRDLEDEREAAIAALSGAVDGTTSPKVAELDKPTLRARIREIDEILSSIRHNTDNED